MRTLRILGSVGILAVGLAPSLSRAETAERPAGTPAEWQTAAVREEVSPRFSYVAHGGKNGDGSFVIKADDREGLDGWWTRTIPVSGGRWYRFSALRRIDHVSDADRTAVVRLLWQDAKGRMATRDEPAATKYLNGQKFHSQPEHPRDGATDAEGWTEVSGVYQVPSSATQAVVELHLRWPSPQGRIEWCQVSLSETSPLPSRKVRLASVHFRSNGKTPDENCRMFAPFIEDAARQHADLVVLPEGLTTAGNVTSQVLESGAESVPGPSTEYFGELAKKHNLYIVAGLYERAGHLIYNTSALVGPDGRMVGKYRKVTLPRGEITGGVAPGHEYPVFDTRFGKVGMMICYDGFFPEVARHLSENGAEVIAWPVAGCNPQLGRARAIENHVYVVSSTYTDIAKNWMLTAVFDHEGNTLAVADKFGTVIVAEVDLNQRTLWPSLGDFQSEWRRHKPQWDAESRK